MSNQTNNALEGLKSGIKGVHGLGEQIRGTLNQAVDATFHEPTGEAKNQAIAEKGEQDVNQAVNKLSGGQGSATTGGVSDTGVPTTTTSEAPAAGAHATSAGNIGQGSTTGTTQI